VKIGGEFLLKLLTNKYTNANENNLLGGVNNNGNTCEGLGFGILVVVLMLLLRYEWLLPE